MGASHSNNGRANHGTEGYAILRLTHEQSVALHGFARAKTTLTWRDVQERQGVITFANCIRVGVTDQKLYAMQPDLKEWINVGGVNVFDCAQMRLWSPNPFVHFNCCIGDLIVLRRHLPPEVLARAGLTVGELCDRYGLNGELMAMLHYSPDQWQQLQLEERHLDMLSDQQWTRVFDVMTRVDVKAQLVAVNPVTAVASPSACQASSLNPAGAAGGRGGGNAASAASSGLREATTSPPTSKPTPAATKSDPLTPPPDQSEPPCAPV